MRKGKGKKTYKDLIICICVGRVPQRQHKPFSLLINKNDVAKLAEHSGTAADVANKGGSDEAKIFTLSSAHL